MKKPPEQLSKDAILIQLGTEITALYDNLEHLDSEPKDLYPLYESSIKTLLRLNEQFEDLEQQIITLEIENVKTKQELRKSSNSFIDHEYALDQKIDDQQSAISQLKCEIAKINTEKSQLQRSLQANMAAQSTESNKHNQEISKLIAEKQRLRVEIDRQRQANKSLVTESDLNNQLLYKEIGTLKEGMFGLQIKARNYTAAKVQLAAVQQENSDLKAKVFDLESNADTFDATKAQLASLKQELRAMQEKFDELSTLYRQSELDNELLEKDKEASEKRIIELQSELEEIKNSVQYTRLIQLQAELKDTQTQLQVIKQQQQDFAPIRSSPNGFGPKSPEIATQKLKIEQLEKTISQQESEHAKLLETIRGLSERKINENQLTTEIAALKNTIAGSHPSSAATARLNQSLNEFNSKLQEENTALQRSIISVRAELNAIRSELNSENEKNLELSAELHHKNLENQQLIEELQSTNQELTRLKVQSVAKRQAAQSNFDAPFNSGSRANPIFQSSNDSNDDISSLSSSEHDHSGFGRSSPSRQNSSPEISTISANLSTAPSRTIAMILTEVRDYIQEHRLSYQATIPNPAVSDPDKAVVRLSQASATQSAQREEKLLDAGLEKVTVYRRFTESTTLDPSQKAALILRSMGIPPLDPTSYDPDQKLIINNKSSAAEFVDNGTNHNSVAIIQEMFRIFDELVITAQLSTAPGPGPRSN